MSMPDFIWDPQTTADFWDGYLAAADYSEVVDISDDGQLIYADDPLLISDDELAMLSEDIDTWPVGDLSDADFGDFLSDTGRDFDVIAFEDGLGFDVPAWPDMSDDDRNADAPF